jgi:hypothetical protein
LDSDMLNMSSVSNDDSSRCGESDCRIVRSQGYLARAATERRGVARNIACYSTRPWHCKGSHVSSHAILPKTQPMIAQKEYIFHGVFGFEIRSWISAIEGRVLIE